MESPANPIRRLALLAVLVGSVLVFSGRARAEDPYVLWAKTWTAAWGPNAVAVGRGGELYVDSDRNSSQPKLFCFSSTGQLLSTNAHEGFFILDLAFDANGNRYITGAIETNGVFDSQELRGFFVAKHSPDNQLIWVQSESLPSAPATWASGSALAIDPQGNVVVGGAGRGPTTLGAYSFGAAEGQRPLFCKYDRSGNLLWARRIESDGYGYLQDLAVDSSGNIVICGYLWEGTAEFGGVTLFPGTTGHSYNGDWFMAKYGPDGTLKWAQIGYASSLILDPQDNIYAGWVWGFDGQSGLAKLNPAGDVIWSKALPGVYMGGRGSLARTPDGGIVFTGEIDGTAEFDGIRLRARSTGYTDFFVAKANAEGTIEWAISGGGIEHDRGNTVTCDAEGAIYLTGTIRKNVASFAGHSLAPVSDAIGLPTLFAAKLSPTPPLSIQTDRVWTTLIWPTQATNYVLEAATSLRAVSWTTVTNTPIVTTTERSVQLPPTGPAQFFRLRKP